MIPIMLPFGLKDKSENILLKEEIAKLNERISELKSSNKRNCDTNELLTSIKEDSSVKQKTLEAILLQIGNLNDGSSAKQLEAIVLQIDDLYKALAKEVTLLKHLRGMPIALYTF